MVLERLPSRFLSKSEMSEFIVWFLFFAIFLRISQNSFSIEILVGCPDKVTECFCIEVNSIKIKVYFGKPDLVGFTYLLLGISQAGLRGKKQALMWSCFLYF